MSYLHAKFLTEQNAIPINNLRTMNVVTIDSSISREISTRSLKL